ncbi:cupin domain-containing protein [Pseudovibrio exalbescens]|uniref:cupin domain-containing protein n=1 Tax=Pseudovibrio exalbescens TaxID=197461 RepID=UPI000C9A2554|nr:cupin domain-containing protein [Pseudovibrio exalbescens]
MKRVQLKDVSPYEPPKHFGMVALKLHGEAETGLTKFWQGLSHFLPGGGCEWQYEAEDDPGSRFEKTYFVLKGELCLTTKDEEIILREGDSIALLPFEGRKMINKTNVVATALVTVSTL